MQIIKVTPDQIETLANMLELYLYDLNTIFDDRILFKLNSNGRFDFPDIDSFIEDPTKGAYIFWQNYTPIGLILTHQKPFFPKGNKTVQVVAEFFVLRMYRRQKIGINACSTIMHQFPGPWEIRVVKEHTRGLKFWEQVVKTIAPNNYEIKEKFDDQWRGYIFCLDVGQ